ncbi:MULTISPECIES: monofunctional biosynthetic peptidoglycan transglycosylase [Pacificimonas]|nr:MULTISPECIES: monofunctional biosynthetic peptidoglycan transglycosylase [Pacificimonas]MBZ6378341.1 monofunctional biosynthetic peptidoglycan transglycosylase [Pacificimonas aurantium]
MKPLRWLLKALVFVFLFTILWALLYRFVPIPVTTPQLGDYVDGQTVYRSWTPLEEISPNLVRAVIASEDARFCSHNGFDIEAIETAMKANEKGGRLRGASTISQQTAKNAFLWSDRNWLRKGLEAYFTGLIELLWGKHRIMEVYLNVAEMGPGVYGAAAAAQYHYGKSAADLSPNEAARLAAVLPNPIERNAGNPGPFVRRHSGNIQRWIGIVDADGQDDCIFG